MDETNWFATEVSAVFRQLTKAADAADPDVLECDATADMVTFFAPTSGLKVIVNTQRAVHQIWVAGGGDGVHFSFSTQGTWLDDKGKGLELLSWINSCVEKASGVRLQF